MSGFTKFLSNNRKPIIIGAVLIITVVVSLLLANGGSDTSESSAEYQDPNQQTSGEITDAIDSDEGATDAVTDTNDQDNDNQDAVDTGEETTETDVTDEVEEVVPEEPIGPNSILTGLPIPEEDFNTRPIGVMISNIETALPQYGIGDAAVIYEAVVEGGITRLFAVFQSFDTEKIGPVRSSRHYFLDFALDHDAIYTHVGQSPQAIDAFKRLDVDRFYGISYLDIYLTFYDENRKAPHSTFTSYEHLQATWDELDYRREPLEDLTPKFYFEEGFQLEGEPLKGIYLNYSKLVGTNPYFIYNEETGLYDRFQFDEPHMDALTDSQLSFENVIIQFVSQWTIQGDPEGRQDMSLITDGTGYYIQGGQIIPITWSKESHYDTTQYYTESGEPLTMSPGKTFICVYPSYYEDNLVME